MAFAASGEDAGLQAAGDGQPVEVTTAQPALTTESWLTGDRDEEVVRAAHEQTLEASWEDADDCEGDGVDSQDPADDGWVAPELALPESVAEDGSCRSFRGVQAVIGRREQPPDSGRETKYLEKVSRDVASTRRAPCIVDGGLNRSR